MKSKRRVGINKYSPRWWCTVELVIGMKSFDNKQHRTFLVQFWFQRTRPQLSICIKTIFLLIPGCQSIPVVVQFHQIRHCGAWEPCSEPLCHPSKQCNSLQTSSSVCLAAPLWWCIRLGGSQNASLGLPTSHQSQTQLHPLGRLSWTCPYHKLTVIQSIKIPT